VQRIIPCLGSLSKGTFLLGILAGSMPGISHAADPTEPGASVPSSTYRSAFPGAERSYLEQTDVERLPWRKLFEPDGRFVPEPASGTKAGDPAPRMKAHGHMSMDKAAPAATSSTGSDAHGLVKYVDKKRGRVKLKHGPIKRLDMPGMTMVFRVKNPALLSDVKPGDEVGFTIEVDGSTFYVTGFQK
jgi:Cu(I)/Ag(I) efflux system protein CusF